MRDQFISHLLAHRLDRKFGRTIQAHTGYHHPAKLRRDVDDQAGFLRAHLWQSRAGDPLVPHHIGVKQQLHHLHVLQLDRSARADPGVVDDDVESAAIQPFGLHDGIAHRLIRQHIQFENGDIQIIILGGLSQCIRLWPWQIAHGGEHFCALFGVENRTQIAEAGRTAGDQHRLAAQIGLALCSGSRRAGGKRETGGGGGAKQLAAVEGCCAAFFGHRRTPKFQNHCYTSIQSVPQ